MACTGAIPRPRPLLSCCKRHRFAVHCQIQTDQTVGLRCAIQRCAASLLFGPDTGRAATRQGRLQVGDTVYEGEFAHGVAHGYGTQRRVAPPSIILRSVRY
eukprot:2757587-Rhodomonas_salina.2